MSRQIFKLRQYQHIDKIIVEKDLDGIVRKVSNAQWIEHHAFYPFLGYKIKKHKIHKKGVLAGTTDPLFVNAKCFSPVEKCRDIRYASHIDRCIYQWYSHILNERYNAFCTNTAAIAYRTNLHGKTNIDFAKIAFDTIKRLDKCYILVSDFSDFFGSIDHSTLKSNLCKILNVDYLPKDMYAVFKSVTRYSYILKDDIINYLINNHITTEEKLKSCNSLFDTIPWKKAKKDLCNSIHTNASGKGIPQGSSISGVLANIYMIDFDQYLYNYAIAHNGLYMRYSDDLILIIPQNQVADGGQLLQELEKVITRSKVQLQISKKKTFKYFVADSCVYTLNHDSIPSLSTKTFLNYLGFSFDGKYVRFRDATITKAYHIIYRQVKKSIRICKIRKSKGKRNASFDTHHLLKNLDGKNTKTFINYVNRAKRVFPNEKYIVEFRNKMKRNIFDKIAREQSS